VNVPIFSVRAQVRLLPREEGGRKGPTPPNQFGCVAEINGELFDCRLQFEQGQTVSPGDTATVSIAFLSPDLVQPMLKIGDEFNLQEISRIGTAKVVGLSKG
jgi:hypothetical protein